MRRLLITLLAAMAGALLLLGALLGTAAPAQAHTELIGTDPGVGRTVARPPSIVVLQFSEQVLELGARVQVTGPSGRVDDDAPRRAGAAVVEKLEAGLPAGKYTVVWRVTADDGHPVQGSFGFVATGPGAGASSSASPASSSSASTGASPSSPAPTSAEPTPAIVPVDSTGGGKDSRTPGWTIAGLTIVAAGLIAGLIALRRPRARPGSDPGSSSGSVSGPNP